MELKKCNGPLHPPGGEQVPLKDFTYNLTGPRAGKPLSRCKYCRSSGNPKTVPSKVFMPLIEILFEDRDIREVAQLTKLDKNLLRDLKKGKRKRIYKHTYLSLRRAVASLPKARTSIGPKIEKTKRNGTRKLSYEERLALKEKISIEQKKRYKIDKQLLRHVV